MNEKGSINKGSHVKTEEIPYLREINGELTVSSLRKNIDLFEFQTEFSIFLSALRYFSSTKIRPQEKINNFAFKNSNIIIEGLF